MLEVKSEPKEEDIMSPDHMDYGENWLRYELKEEKDEISSDCSSHEAMKIDSGYFNGTLQKSSFKRDLFVQSNCMGSSTSELDSQTNGSFENSSKHSPYCNNKIASDHIDKRYSTDIETGFWRTRDDTCNQSFNESSQLMANTKVRSNKKSHACDACGKSFTQSSTLKDHLRIHVGEKPHGCQICSKKFIKMSNLRHHLRIHMGEKRHECHVCGKKFTYSFTLKRHLRTHTHEKPHQCHMCIKTFADLTTLRRHVRVHTKEKPYKCSVCQNTFTQSANLKRHSMTQHME